MKRKFTKDGVLHIYQRSISGFNIFYRLEDFLSFYTIVSVQSKRIGVELLGMCMMIDHVHLLLKAENLQMMSRFISAYTSIYVREFNSTIGRRGKLFESTYGSAVKTEAKRVRSAIAYLFNNPVEKMLCRVAKDYRWNFLRYCKPGITMSVKRFSRKLRRSMKIVDSTFRCGQYLNQTLIRTLMLNLDEEEKNILTDYIITTYLSFNTQELVSYYKSYEEMITAINSNTGSEYDIPEKHYCKTDAPYREIIRYLNDAGIKDVRSLIVMPEKIKRQYLIQLKSSTSASYTQIRKFLHIAENT